MGLYYETIFYSDIDKMTEGISIAQLDPIIDENDTKRGYVLKEELLQFYRKFVTPEMITEKSYLVQYIVSTLDNNPSRSESFIIPVK